MGRQRPDNIQVTTLQVAICTGILLAVDVVLSLLARRFISREDFRHLRFTLAVLVFAIFEKAFNWGVILLARKAILSLRRPAFG
ncbi:MAG: hypothetical protein C3F13_13040 [Anaerolineales bacterium]|nr:hypothetical protein [Anaerolineae bacterium]PWB51367.1 MAG: hypothetical protein C3F13_13040 [Anaerolineales bacterium]